MKNIIYQLFMLILILINSVPVLASSTQSRIDKDIANGQAIVIQLSVALADNKYQKIVPVPEIIGNGQNPRTNLYWGALYGVKTFMTRDAGWKKLATLKVSDNRILERIVLKKTFTRKKQPVSVYLVADAWDGRYISDTISRFMHYNGGGSVYEVSVDGKQLLAGGKAHLIAYIGHNALMDYTGNSNNLFSPPRQTVENPNNDAIVLACISQSYFSTHLSRRAAHPLLLTTGLMAPEAYSLNAAITPWIEGANDKQVRKAAAKSYHRYQKTGVRAAQRLFGVK